MAAAPGLLVVTGGSQGLGAAIVAQALAAGDTVIAAARGPAPAVADPERLFWTSVDLADPQAASDWMAHALAVPLHHVPSRLRLILNAGMIEPLVPVSALAPVALDRHLRLNLTGAMLVAARFLEATESFGQERRVLAISSGAGRRGIPHWSAYCAAKSGLDGFVRALNTESAADRSDRVRAVSLAPGVVDTGMQQTVRETEAPMQTRFRELHASGSLASPETAAAQVLAYLEQDDFGAFEIDDFWAMAQRAHQT